MLRRGMTFEEYLASLKATAEKLPGQREEWNLLNLDDPELIEEWLDQCDWLCFGSPNITGYSSPNIAGYSKEDWSFEAEAVVAAYKLIICETLVSWGFWDSDRILLLVRQEFGVKS